MSSLPALRERGRWTRAAILSLLVQQPGLSRTAIATHLGLTVQAVSIQVQAMLDEGLIHDDQGLFIRPIGVQRLQQDADQLNAAAQELRRPLSFLAVLRAVADAPIREGQEVDLYMHDGDLHAKPGNSSPSRGIASNAAQIGDEVRIRGPTGIVALNPGTIHVIRVPEATLGGIRRVDTAAIEPWHGVVGAVGTGASILAGRIDRLYIRFAAAEAAINAAQRGLDVRLYVDGEQIAEALQTIEAGNKGPVRVDVQLRDAPLKAA